ncbi:hypothetical protein [Propioniciclava soli]|uniref:hypothetical protein n=1 Tax=Propioniciclava soli TaxID=2775081 RepID=UPI001E3BC3C3|nr:hypothetical protein [Propioniciclava soli]
MTYSNVFAFTPTDPASHTMLDPWLYGAAVVIPPAAALTTDAWTITAPWVAWTMNALKAFGWFQTAILIAGVTGLLRKT